MRLENCRPFSLKNFGLNYIGYFNIYYYSILAKYNIEILYDAVYKIDISAARDIQIVMNLLKRRIILLNDAGINGLIQIPNRPFYGFSTLSLSLPSDSIEISSIKYDNNDCYEFKSKIDNLIKLKDGEYVEGRLLYNINSILKIEKKLWSSYDYTIKFDNDGPGFHIFEANYNDEKYKDFIKNLRRISYHVCDYLNDAIQIILNRMTDTNEYYYYICTMCSQVYYKSHILDLEDDKCQNCGAPSSQIIKYNFPLIENYKYNFDIL